jgi:hypothetical protein
MKKLFSISLSLLMVASILHISVAIHYCGGKEVATTVSLSGNLASCGMECSEKELPLSGTYFNKQCCDDIVTTFGIDNHYTPTYAFLPESYQYNYHVLAILVELLTKSRTDHNLLYTNLSPPGVLMSTNVDLSNICVFRI